jgi:hypothetical protein
VIRELPGSWTLLFWWNRIDPGYPAPSINFVEVNMARKRSIKPKVEMVGSIQLALRIDMGQAENIIQQLAKAYGWDQLEEIIRRLREQSAQPNPGS